MKIDAHQHFWKYSSREYGWIDEPMKAIRCNFLPADLAAVLSQAGIDRSIAVQARQTIEETRWLLSLARDNPRIAAVVGWVPLASSTIGEVLDEFADCRELRGVRHVVQGEPDPAFLEGAAFNHGVRTAGERGLVYDVLIFARQLPAAIKFVGLHPNQTFVLDHIAKPVVQGPPDATWRSAIHELAKRERVYCKFSGVVTEVPGWKWTPELIAPYFDVVLEAFGPQRLMFGSDWPVCLVASDYVKWVRMVEACAAKLSADERARLFGGTAAEAYGLS